VQHFFSIAIFVHFNLHWGLSIVFFLIFGFVDANFLAANLLKFTTGGWFSVTLSTVLVLVLITWRYGRNKMTQAQAKMTVSEADLFVVNRPRRPSEDVPLLQMDAVSLMICFSSSTERVPAAVVHFLKRLPVRPRVLALVTVTVVDIPFVERAFVCHKIAGFENVYRVIVYHGYAEVSPEAANIAVQIAIQANCLQLGSASPPSDAEILDMVDPTFVVGQDHVYCAKGSSTFHRFAVACFSALLKFSRSPLAPLNLPPESTLEIGVQVEI